MDIVCGYIVEVVECGVEFVFFIDVVVVVFFLVDVDYEVVVVDVIE